MNNEAAFFIDVEESLYVYSFFQKPYSYVC